MTKHNYHSDRGSLVPKCMFYLKNLSENKVRRYAITDALHLLSMGLLPDTQNGRLRMRRECRERFPPPLISKETAF